MSIVAEQIVAEQFDAVIGVDTHTDTHAAAVLNRWGAVLAQTEVPADAAGAARLLAWAGVAGPGLRLWAVDGSRSHGQGLATVLRAAREQITEAARPARGTSRRGGKSDALDAVHIAQRALGTRIAVLGQPRADGLREALRILLTCRRHDTDTRTATVNLFKSLILTADEATRAMLRGQPIGKQTRLAAASAQLSTHDDTPETVIRRTQLAALAADIAAATTRINTNLRQLRHLVTQLCPALLDQPGVGPVTAATLLTTWSHRGRFRHEAAYAALAGVNPIPASSGRVQRHRLNRGGDRHLNTALHTIAITRRRYHPATRDYLNRRTAEGKTPREITRCLKRYIARQLFKIMETNTITP